MSSMIAARDDLITPEWMFWFNTIIGFTCLAVVVLAVIGAAWCINSLIGWTR